MNILDLTTSELRQDAISKRWVIFQQYKIPLHDKIKKFLIHNSDVSLSGERKKTSTDICPFCPGSEELTNGSVLVMWDYERDRKSFDWQVRVFEAPDCVLQSTNDPKRSAKGIYDCLDNFGIHEIVVETPEHGFDIFERDCNTIHKALETYKHRLIEHKRNHNIKGVSFIRKYGERAGQKIDHAHGHILATQVFSKKINQELNNARNHYRLKERCLFCDVIDQEKFEGTRIIDQNDDFIVYCPYASRFPFELVVFPIKHAVDFEASNSRLLESLSSILRSVMSSFRTVLDNPSYMLMLHNGPNRANRKIDTYWDTIDDDYHWYLELIPFLLPVAAFEVGTGIYINPVLPEESAELLRNNIPVLSNGHL